MAQRREKEKEDEDEEPKFPWETGDEQEDDDDGPVRPRVPRMVDWYTFLQHQGWTDQEVLDRQRADWVMECREVYDYQQECGLLRKGLF